MNEINETKVGLVILLTGGIVGDAPSDHGKLRIAKARKVAEENGCPVLVLGGIRDHGMSEAQVYARAMHWAGDIRVIARAAATMTAVDLRECRADIVRLAAKDQAVAVVSNPRHAARAAVTLNWLGYQNVSIVDSGERSPYSVAKEAVLYALTRLDPGFIWVEMLLGGESRRRKEGRRDTK